MKLSFITEKIKKELAVGLIIMISAIFIEIIIAIIAKLL